MSKAGWVWIIDQVGETPVSLVGTPDAPAGITEALAARGLRRGYLEISQPATPGYRNAVLYRGDEQVGFVHRVSCGSL